MSPSTFLSLDAVQKICFGPHPRRTLVRIAIWAAATIAFVHYVAKPARLRGTSMLPTLKDGSFHVINLLTYRFRLPRRGDIVAVRMTGERTFYLKRVLGTPGDRVTFVDGVLHINGGAVEEPYVRFRGRWNMSEIPLQSNEYFVAGDHRAVPPENHVMGVVDLKQIAGSLLF